MKTAEWKEKVIINLLASKTLARQEEKKANKNRILTNVYDEFLL
jgi:hypothetical protein